MQITPVDLKYPHCIGTGCRVRAVRQEGAVLFVRFPHQAQRDYLSVFKAWRRGDRSSWRRFVFRLPMAPPSAVCARVFPGESMF